MVRVSSGAVFVTPNRPELLRAAPARSGPLRAAPSRTRPEAVFTTPIRSRRGVHSCRPRSAAAQDAGRAAGPPRDAAPARRRNPTIPPDRTGP